MNQDDAPSANTDRAVTIADVARAARVSTAAVSFYFSTREEHLKRVGAETRERIRIAVEQLGYVQNKTARHLRRQRSERICIVLSKLGVPFADRMVQDLESVAARHGILPIVLTGSSVTALRTILGEVEGGLADGVIAEVAALSEEEVEEAFGSFTRPCLVIHPTARSKGHSVLNSDMIGALLEAFDDLLAKGHRNFVYVRNSGAEENPRILALRQRVAAYDGTRMLIIDGASSRDAAARRAREIAAMPQCPTAVLLESDFTAVTMIEEFTRLGLRVPNDIAVVGCGNAEEGYFCNPRLTTIGPEWISLIEAGQHLIDRLDPRKSVAARSFRTPWRFLRRESA